MSIRLTTDNASNIFKAMKAKYFEKNGMKLTNDELIEKMSEVFDKFEINGSNTMWSMNDVKTKEDLDELLSNVKMDLMVSNSERDGLKKYILEMDSKLRGKIVNDTSIQNEVKDLSSKVAILTRQLETQARQIEMLMSKLP
jgi:enolase